MAGPKTYIGVSSKARKVDKVYVGVSGKARKVKKIYAGVGGKAKLVYSADFWLPAGLSVSDCLAAYQFKGAASETAACTDLTGHGYTLTKIGANATWATGTGYTIPSWGGLDNQALRKKDPATIIARFTNNSPAYINDDVYYQCAQIYEGYQSAHPYRRLYLSTAFGTHSFYFCGSGNIGCQYKADYTVTPNVGVLVKAQGYSKQTTTSGVVGVSFNGDNVPTFYQNGTAITLLAPNHDSSHGLTVWPTTDANYAPAGRLIGMRANNDRRGRYDDPESWYWSSGYKLQAIAFFSKVLTAAQHKSVCDAMNLL